MSHDGDDSQPPNLSYAVESVHSNTESEGEESDEEEGGVSDTPPDQMDWEHLEPSAEEVRLFEEEQMKLALAVSPSASDRVSMAHKHAQEVENYRQKLRRLDYNTTYMDYATHGVSSASLDAARQSATDSAKSIGSSSGEGRSKEEKPLGVGTAAAATASTSPAQQGVASGLLGTLSSLWTSTFGGKS